MARRLVLGTIFISSFLYAYCSAIDIDNKKVELVSTHDMKNCVISFVSIDGKLFLVKMKKRVEKKPFAPIKDALAAYIAHIFKIAHSVTIIPMHKDFPGKKANVPATLHSIAAGDTLSHLQDTEQGKIYLKQWYGHDLSFEKQGLTRDIIYWMTQYKILAILVALDSFIGNGDRHRGNLFYDAQTGTFCAIDMDSSFAKDLCRLAHEKLIMMRQDRDNPFSRKELDALVVYRQTIKKLLKKYTVQDLQKKLLYFVEQAGFVPGNSVYRKWNIKRKLMHYNDMIAKNYASAKILVAFLDEWLN